MKIEPVQKVEHRDGEEGRRQQIHVLGDEPLTPHPHTGETDAIPSDLGPAPQELHARRDVGGEILENRSAVHRNTSSATSPQSDAPRPAAMCKRE